MNPKELKEELIKELGSLPYETRKKINSDHDIPDEELDNLIKKNKRRHNIAKGGIIIAASCLLAILAYYTLMNEKIDKLLFFSWFLLMIIIQLAFNKDFRDSSKRNLIFTLLKRSK